MMDRMKNRKLTDDDIVKEIINYVDETLYNYAIMIDGEWGCGKTYFVKEKLCKELEEHENEQKRFNQDYQKRQIIYVSLYGVKSIEETTKQLFMETLVAKVGKKKGMIKKGTEAISSMFPLVFDILKNKGMELDVNNIIEATENLIPIKNSILIFDDLERCVCPINELLGYINSFVEHENMKVIIVANQKEIRNGGSPENQELKYLVAAQDNIIFEKDQKSEVISEYSNLERYNKSPVDIETVKDRVQKLFTEDNLYDKIKEKLIGVTIYYQPDLQTVFQKLITSANLEVKLKEYLNDYIGFFEEYMTNEVHSNIRTFQFFLSKINQLYKKIVQLEENGWEDFLKYIIEYSFKISVSFKNGDYRYEWKGREEYAFKSIGSTDILGDQERQAFIYGDSERKIQGCIQNGINEKIANHLFDEMLDFAKYAFNKSHAAAYAVVSYQTAWLKYHYPAEYLCAMFSNKEVEKYQPIYEDCYRYGVEILPPDINRSCYEFIIEDESKIRYGFCGIKGIGEEESVQGIISKRTKIRTEDSYASVRDFLERNDSIKKNLLECLINAGCFDALYRNREQLILDIKNDRIDDLIPADPVYNRQQELLLMGNVNSENPLREYRDETAYGCTPFYALTPGKNCIMGYISQAEEKTSKKGNKMTFLTLISKSGIGKVLFMRQDLAQYINRVVKIKGTFENGTFFGKEIYLQQPIETGYFMILDTVEKTKAATEIMKKKEEGNQALRLRILFYYGKNGKRLKKPVVKEFYVSSRILSQMKSTEKIQF